MEDLLNVTLMIVSGIIVVLVLMQSGKSDGLSAAFTGSGDLNLFKVTKDRGPAKILSRTTFVFMVAYFALVIALQFV